MVPAPNADLALSVLEKGAKHGAKDPEYFIAMGDAYHAKLDNSKAYGSYRYAFKGTCKLKSPDLFQSAL